MKTKTCNDCNEAKPKIEYAPSMWSKPSHYQLTCRKCINKSKRCRPNKSGSLYIITNNAWIEWCKIGVTTRDIERRLSLYQTCSPHRDYCLQYILAIDNIYAVEEKLHKLLEEAGVEKNNEWFKADHRVIVAMLHGIKNTI